MSDETDDGEFTELINPDISRVDVVDKAANGTTILIAKREGDGDPSLFGADFVREMIAKADAEAPAAAPAPPADTVTMTGSPGALAQLMKEAADRAAVRDVAKAQLSTADINDLPDSAFAYIEPGGSKDSDGKTTPRKLRHFPVHDEAHARDALSRAPQSPFGPKAMPKIRAAAKHFGIEVAKADGYSGDATVPGSPAWESQDADTAEGLVQAVLALRPRLEAFAAREGAEYGAGDMGDLADVFDVQAARDCLMQAAKLLGGVAVAERAEAGTAMVKGADAASEPTPPPAAPAAPSPTQESTVSDTQGGAAATTDTTATAEVAKGEGALSEAQLAELGRAFLAKAAKKAAKRAAAAATQTTGAAPAPTDARVIPGTDTVQSPAMGPDDVTKAAAAQLAAALSEAMAPVTKQLNELVTKAESQQARVEKALAEPDDRRSPQLNGATGVPGIAPGHFGNGFERSTAFEPVRKALAALPDGPEKEQAQREVGLAAVRGRFGN